MLSNINDIIKRDMDEARWDATASRVELRDKLREKREDRIVIRVTSLIVALSIIGALAALVANLHAKWELREAERIWAAEGFVPSWATNDVNTINK